MTAKLPSIHITHCKILLFITHIHRSLQCVILSQIESMHAFCKTVDFVVWRFNQLHSAWCRHTYDTTLWLLENRKESRCMWTCHESATDGSTSCHLKGTINVLFGPPTLGVQYNYTAHYPGNDVHIWRFLDGRAAHLAFMQETGVCVPSRGLNNKDNVRRIFCADNFKFYSKSSLAQYILILETPKFTPT